ncbi:hypothetical protein CA13_20990 [Planctomycetes bacterium CA13]|uniref:Uncharacterized protein n=1 Tax=Novipirellula herctigrandis TaxID=2527986 RepID=A0A5C5Z029_9BACT|nr:hypothetical protein CA13_20990 [Planctomycetes bacterium CA13]
MDEMLGGPRLEKRIMPLLDVALSLVGVLILMVSISNEQRESGVEGNVATLIVLENGNVMFGDSILATTESGVDKAKFERFFEELETLDAPLVLMYYTRPSDEDQSVNADVIATCIGTIEARGFNLKAIGRDKPEGASE